MRKLHKKRRAGKSKTPAPKRKPPKRKAASSTSPKQTGKKREAGAIQVIATPVEPEQKRRGGNPPVEHQFKLGGPPGPGRPKGSLEIWARIRRLLLETVPNGEHAGSAFADHAAKAFVKAVLGGKWPQMKELIDREEGPIPTKLANAGDGPLKIEVNYVNKPPPSDRADDPPST